MITNFDKYILENNNEIVPNEFNNIIDFTNLKNYSNIDNLMELCETAIENKFYSVCVLPEFINTVSSIINTEDIKRVMMYTEIKDSTNDKLKKISNDITDFDELDLLIDFNLLKKLSYEEDEDYTESYETIKDEIERITRYCHKEGKIIKIIIEVEELTINEIKTIADLCTEYNVDFIQTSSGFSKKVESFEDKLAKIKYLRKILPDYINIKASGGIRTVEQINQLLPYVDRIGTSVIIK